MVIDLVRFHFPGCVVEINETNQVAVTIFHDGSRSAAAPNHDEESRAKAVEFGYGGDVWAMTREHELGHAVLAAGRSPVVWRDAHPELGIDLSDGWWREEAAVVAWQRYRTAVLGVGDSLHDMMRDYTAERLSVAV